MGEIETSWWVAGGLILIAGLYVLMLNMLPIMERVNFRKVVRKTAKEENQEFLIENASYHDFASKKWYWGLLLTVFAVYITLTGERFYSEGYEETFFTLTVSLVFMLTLLAHGAVAVIGFLWVVCSWGDENRSTLHVRDFLKSEEINLMKWVRREHSEKTQMDIMIEDDYRNEGSLGYWNVHMPDLMVSVMKDRAKLMEYAEVQQKIHEMKDIDKSLLTPEQVKRNESFEQQYKESLFALVPHLKQIMLATDKAHFKAEEKKKLDKVRIRNDFDQKQTEVEQALMALNESIRFKQEKEVESEPVSEAIREIQRVAESELVSPQLKEQASTLIGRIEEKQVEMRHQQERELVDRDAVSIIRANELYYGLDTVNTQE